MRIDRNDREQEAAWNYGTTADSCRSEAMPLRNLTPARGFTQLHATSRNFVGFRGRAWQSDGSSHGRFRQNNKCPDSFAVKDGCLMHARRSTSCVLLSPNAFTVNLSLFCCSKILVLMAAGVMFEVHSVLRYYLCNIISRLL